MKRQRGLRVLIVLLVFPLLIASEGLAQDVKKVGTSAATFLRIPVGVRGVAMGSAFVAIADDPSAMFWNPAGIARMENISLFVDHSPWLPGLTFNYFGVVLPIQSFGTVGVNVTALTTAEMLVTTIEDPMGDPNNTFTAGSYAIGFSYAPQSDGPVFHRSECEIYQRGHSKFCCLRVFYRPRYVI